MRIIGIDPGFAITGWAVLDFVNRDISEVLDYGVIETSKDLSNSERLKIIFDDLIFILEKFSPKHAGVETLLFCNNVKTAMQVGEARGVVILALEQQGIGVNGFTPLQVKSSVSGYGKAKKRQVQENVKRICGFEDIPKPDDAADAIAVAICCNDSLVLSNLNN